MGIFTMAGYFRHLPQLQRGLRGLNIGKNERWASALLGVVLSAYALKRRGVTGLVAGFVGGLLVKRGSTGECPVYRNAGVTSV